MSLQFSSIKAVKMGEIYYYEDSNAFVVDLVDNYEKAVQENEELQKTVKKQKQQLNYFVDRCLELKGEIFHLKATIEYLKDPIGGQKSEI